jgi:hypothetical protein
VSGVAHPLRLHRKGWVRTATTRMGPSTHKHQASHDTTKLFIPARISAKISSG